MDYESKYNELAEAIRTVVDDNPSLFNVYDDLGRLRDLLPQKESEDERIREEIIQFFKDASSGKTRVITSETFVKWIEFFEKYKEQKPVISDEAIRDGVVHFGITQYQIDNWLKKHINVVEQNPTEWSEDFEENIRNLLHDKLTGHSEDGSMSWTTLIDDKTLKDIVNGIWFYVGKEALKYSNKELSQPEWSEEDEWKRNELLKYLEEKGDYRTVWMTWLKSFSERFNPQPHWKPNEEQMEALRRATYRMGNSCFGKSAANDENLHSLYVALKKLM